MERTVARLRVDWHRRADLFSQADRAMQVSAVSVRALDEVFGFALVVSGGRDRSTEAWFEVETFGAERTVALAEQIRAILCSHSPWLGLGRPELAAPAEDGPERYEIEVGVGQALSSNHAWSPTWNSVSQLADSAQLRAELRAISTEAGEPPVADIALTVSGADAGVRVTAQLLAQELSQERALQVHRLTTDRSARSIRMSIGECGRVFSIISRISEGAAWPDHPVDDFATVVERLRRSPAAIAVVGTSGFGKTTLTEHIATQSLGEEVLIVICPHGDLSARMAATAERRGIPYDALWFGDPITPATWDLLQSVHPSISQEEWLTLLPGIVLAPHRRLGLTYSMAGPAWHFNFASATETLARSERGTLSDAPALLSDSELRRDLADAIDDLPPDLRRRIRQAREAILRSSDGSFAVFQNSKLEFLRAPAVARVLAHRRTSFDLSTVFDQRRSLFVSVSTSELGDMGASVLITALLTAIYEIARRRPADQRTPVRLIIPEAHLVDPELLRRLLAEGRKFGITGMVLDLQTPTTLDKQLLSSLLTNTGAIASFRLGPADATLLDGRYPTISVRRLQQLPQFRAAVTFGDEDLLTDIDPPLSDPTDTSAFEERHRATHHPAPAAAEPTYTPELAFDERLDDLFGPIDR